ncbi:MAG: DUF2934 domain-containing protein [Candidatus Omnitrophica bacterium]|nr:DUF2934 domain-containing protein [Candidatus Omnitrophota bacterium]
MAFDKFSKVTASWSFSKVNEEKLQQMIKGKAYHIWERKGKPSGKDWENWLQAEKQIRAKYK